jgi:suppressor of G2 allele of SKP1
MSCSLCRHDFYQTDSAVYISVYVKGCKAEEVEVKFAEDSLALTITSPSASHELHISPLYASVEASASSYKVLGSKVEITLRKAIVGVQWKKLQGEQGERKSSMKSGNRRSLILMMLLS